MKYLIPILVVLLLGCKKTEDRSCFKSVGGLTTKEIALEHFDKLYMGPHLKYVLVQDTVEKVILHGGKNLLNFIETSIEDGQLSVRNNNSCNFLRDYSKVVTVEIHVKKIINILFEGTHEVVCPKTLNTDYLVLVIRDGAGEVNLDINAYELWTTVTHGWGNFTFTGDVNYLNLNVKSNGFGDAYSLNVNDSMHVISNTTEVLKVRPDGCSIAAQTFTSGDIWYIGSPTSVDFNAYGTGELIDRN